MEAEDESNTADPIEQAEVERPSDTELEIEAEVSREIDRRPKADACARVAQRRRMSRAEVEQAVFNVGEYRNLLADDVRQGMGDLIALGTGKVIRSSTCSLWLPEPSSW